jgi:hypothetical protein
MFKSGATTVRSARPVLSLDGSPLYLLFLQEIISDGSLLCRRNARPPAASSIKEQRDNVRCRAARPLFADDGNIPSNIFHAMVSDDRKLMLDIRFSYCQNNINMPSCQSIMRLARPIPPARSCRCSELGFQPVVFATHGVDPVDAFEPAHRKMTACYILEVLDKGEIDGRTA